MTQHGKILSPCVNVCILDAGTQMCVGCFRTIEEIAEWSVYSDDQRARVCGDLAVRRAGTSVQRGIQAGQAIAPNQCCQKCGAAFVCGMSNDKTPCWCAGLPPITPPDPSNASCLCPECLRGIVEGG